MKKIVAFIFIIVISTFLGLMVSCGNGEKVDELTDLSFIQMGKTDYYVGEEFNPDGFVLQATYSLSGSKEIALTSEMYTKPTLDKVGSHYIDIIYEGKHASLGISVLEKKDEVDIVVKIEVKTLGTNVYSFDTNLDLSDYVFILTYKSGKTLEINGNDPKLTSDITSFIEKDSSYEQDVVISYDNKVNVQISVSVLDEWDYEDYIIEKETNELLSKVESDCARIITSEVTDDLALPTNADYNYRLKLSWTSSNEKVISVSGRINPHEEDEKVLLTLDVYPIGSGTLLKHYDFNVVVKGLGPIDFPDLTNKIIVMAYFYEGTFREMPKSDGNRIDIMNYCFGRVTNGKLTITGLGKINTVMKWRREYKMRVLLSIGGGASGGFSSACKDDASRKVFIDSIMDVIKEYGFDGIDMDWEYPGWSGLADSTAYDVINFSYLLRDLRAAMDEYKSGLLLTAAVISSSTDKFYQPKELNKYLDYVNIMTYDGNNTGLATHHTKPYGSGYSAKNAIDMWIAAGVDAKKIIVGAAFYGKISELSSPVSNPEDALGKATISTSTITYSRIASTYLNDPTFKECYDATTGAFYLSDGKYFITYDNYDSILKKADLIREYNLGGMMFWDYGSDNTGLLLSAVSAGIKALNN